jgi:hypothetical protein
VKKRPLGFYGVYWVLFIIYLLGMNPAGSISGVDDESNFNSDLKNLNLASAIKETDT